MEISRITAKRQAAIERRIAYEKRYYAYHRRHIPLDSLGRIVCQKLEKNFANDTVHLPQVLWVYHTANAIFTKTLELSRYGWLTKERANHAREVQILKGFLYKDLLKWEKTS
jgi:hypothetical protein